MRLHSILVHLLLSRATGSGFASVAGGWPAEGDFEYLNGQPVSIALMSDSLRSCLIVTNATLPEPISGNGSCISTPGWKDGTNG